MTSNWQKLQWLIEKAKQGGFDYDPKRIFISVVGEQIKENSQNKVIWHPAFLTALYGDEARTHAHGAVDELFTSGNVIDYHYRAVQGLEPVQSE